MNPSTQKHAFFTLGAWTHFFILGIFFVTCFVLGAINYPLFDLDEGAFSQATLEMQYRGNYIATYLNDVPRYDKPIFAYWMQLIAINVWGPTEFGFRFASILAAAFWATLIYWIVGKLYDSKKALWAAVAFMTSLIVMVVGKAATADSLLNLFIVATQLFLYLFFTQQQSKYIYLATIASALGFLTKGPVAIVLPLLTSIAFVITDKKWSLLWQILKTWRAWLIFSLIALPWYFWITYVEGVGFLKGFILEHNIGRFSSSMESHSGPFYFYLMILPLVILPHTYYLPTVYRKIISAWKSDQFVRFLVLWFLVVIVLFSFSATKLPHYFLYGLTPLFILLGIVIEESGDRIAAIFTVLLVAFITVFLPLILTRVVDLLPDPYLKDMLSGDLLSDAEWNIFLAILLGTLILMLIPKKIFSGIHLLGGATRYALALLLFAFSVNWGYMGLAARAQQDPIREAALLAKNIHKPVVVWRQRTPSFSVYYGAVVKTAEPKIGELFLTKSKNLIDIQGYQVLYEKRGIVLAEKI